MNETTQVQRRLQRFGLTSKQAEIYILLLREGNLRISDIVRKLKIPRSSVYEILKGLLELGLTEEIVENSYKVIKAYPIGSIRHRLTEKINLLERQNSELGSLEKALEVLPAIKSPVPITIRYYKGKSGARQLFWNSLSAKGILYVESEWGRGRYLGIDFYKRFVAESNERDVKEQVLTNSSEQVLTSIRQHINTPVSRTSIETIRCFNSETLLFKGETLIYDNIYAYIILKNKEISGFEIESKQFCDTQRAIFESMWMMATPISRHL